MHGVRHKNLNFLPTTGCVIRLNRAYPLCFAQALSQNAIKKIILEIVKCLNEPVIELCAYALLKVRLLTRVIMLSWQRSTAR